MAIIPAGNVVITKEEYDELMDDSLFLNCLRNCLRNGGWDNWELYDQAVEEFNQIKGEIE